MNKQLLQERLERLEAEKTQLLANLNAYDGAIQECTYWLNQLPPSLVDMIKEATNEKNTKEETDARSSSNVN